MDPQPGIGACLVADTPTDPPAALPPSVGEAQRDGPRLAADAAATALVRRLRALEPAVSVGGLPVPEAVAAAEAATEGAHPQGVLGGRRGLPLVELGAALDTGWLEVRRQRPTAIPDLVGGREWPRVHDHPLAPWGELVGPLIAGGSLPDLTAAPGWLDEQLIVVPPLLLQRLVKGTTPVDVAWLVDALAAEVAEAASREPGVKLPSRRQVAARVTAAGALLVELGLARWDHTADRRLGELVITWLGCFGWLLVVTHIDGELPAAVDRVIRAHGYVKTDGGYIAPEHQPVPLSEN